MADWIKIPASYGATYGQEFLCQEYTMIDLERARTARALRVIEQFSPNPPPNKTSQLSRTELALWLGKHWSALRSATKQELLEIVSILEACLRRQSR